MNSKRATRTLTRSAAIAAILIALPIAEVRAAAPPQTLTCTLQLLRGGNGPEPSPSPSPTASPTPAPSSSPSPTPMPSPSSAGISSVQNPAQGLAKWEILNGERVELKRSDDNLFMQGGATFPFSTGDYRVRIETQYTGPTLNSATPRELVQGYAYLEFVEKDAAPRVIAVQPLSSWQVSIAQIERNRRPNLRAFEATLMNPEPHSFALGKGTSIWDAFRNRQLPATMAVMAKVYCYGN